KNFADPSNWSDRVGCLQWMGKRHAIEFAQSVVNEQNAVKPEPKRKCTACAGTGRSPLLIVCYACGGSGDQRDCYVHPDA
ncbi:MAG TPA: hypothetical protein VIY48_04830, partial [Candidatus Paceibacterota bacterium]